MFIIITFCINTIIGIFPIIMGKKWAGAFSMIVGAAYMLIPALVAVFVQKIIYKEKLKENLRINFKINRWFVFGWILPVVLTFLTIGTALLIPGVAYSPGMEGMFERLKGSLTPEQIIQTKQQIAQIPYMLYIAIVVIEGMIAGITINAIIAFGEELGWRGFLLKEFKPLGFSKSALIIGFIWGLWHAPLILQGHNYPQHPVAGVFMMIVWCMLLTPLFNYVTIKSNSVIAASIFHGTLNAVAGLSIMVIVGGNDLSVGMTGLAGFGALIIANVCIYLYEKFVNKENSVFVNY